MALCHITSLTESMNPLVQKSFLSLAGIAAVGMMAVPFSAFAYEDMRIKIETDNGKIEVEVKYEDGDDDKEKEFVFATTNLDEAYRLTAEKLKISVAQVKDAVVEIKNDSSDDDSSDNDRSDATEAIRDAKKDIADAERYLAKNPGKQPETANLAKAKTLLADAEKAFASQNFSTAEKLADQAEDLAESIDDDKNTKKSKDKSVTVTKPSAVAPSTTEETIVLQRRLLALLQELIKLLQAQQR